MLHHAAERGDSRRGAAVLSGARAFQPQCRSQRFPGFRFGSRGGRDPLHYRGALTAEVREINPQDAEESRPSGFGAFNLIVPFVRAGEEAMHYAYDACASRARFDAPLVRDDRRARLPTGSFGGPPARRIPCRHVGTGFHARAEVQLHFNGLAVAPFEFSRHEPGRNARPGRDGLPDFFRRAGDFHFDLDGTASGSFFLHAHDGSLELELVLVLDFCGSACATITRRCARPPGADSSWYFETSFAMASVSSLLKAARSVAERKRISESTARVANRLPVSFARRTRSPTSCTTRAPRAMR